MCADAPPMNQYPRPRGRNHIMSVVPKEVVAKIQFFEDHESPWTTNATAIGLTAGEVTALSTKTAAARAAYDAQQAAKNAAKDATLTLRLAVTAMADAGSDAIKKIRAKAATDGSGVYALASIPAPATPSPVPPPGTPTDFNVTLNPDGSLKLRWKCANPSGSQGTMYQVSRRIGASGPFVAVGGSGTRSFDDVTVPAGTASVTYQVQAVRSTAVGVAAQFIVNFGISGGGEMTAMVVQGGQSGPKLAA
jgi:hypothetical protein